MLTLYAWTTQNARKITIMLEECGLPYRISPVDILKDEQHSPAFRQLNPNRKIPVLVDDDLCGVGGEPLTVFETGAILLYLAEKSGRFLSPQPGQRAHTLSWLFWQTSGVGPAFGNLAHFASAGVQDRTRLNGFLEKTGAREPVQYAIQRFAGESLRLLGVLDEALAENPYVAGELSIADFALYPWVESGWPGLQSLHPTLSVDFARVEHWMNRLDQREALRRGMQRLAWGAPL
ncbi:MAG TPA: glutathione S-transferase N-terminal domain-containing protein [Pseudomonas sp.]|nr:glutathione S-transferase N-terminal domain-containing protein [Pseudomonas sp.]